MQSNDICVPGSRKREIDCLTIGLTILLKNPTRNSFKMHNSSNSEGSTRQCKCLILYIHTLWQRCR